MMRFHWLLNRSLRRLASQGDKVSLNEFVNGLHDIQMGSVEEATRIFKAFEVDFTGYIDMNTFLYELRLLSPVNDFRIYQSWSISNLINYY